MIEACCTLESSPSVRVQREEILLKENRMNTVEIVPQVPQDHIQKANQDLEALKLRLVDYEVEAKALNVVSPESYEFAGVLLKKIRDNRKEGMWIMAPLKSIARTISNAF